jgi:hypothetical protein
VPVGLGSSGKIGLVKAGTLELVMAERLGPGVADSLKAVVGNVRVVVGNLTVGMNLVAAGTGIAEERLGIAFLSWKID